MLKSQLTTALPPTITFKAPQSNKILRKMYQLSIHPVVLAREGIQVTLDVKVFVTFKVETWCGMLVWVRGSRMVGILFEIGYLIV